MKKSIMLIVIMAIVLGACKKDKALNIKDYVVLFNYGIYAGPPYPNYGIIIPGENNIGKMMTTLPSEENVVYKFENNKLIFPEIKAELDFKEGRTNNSEFYFKVEDEFPGGQMGNVLIIRKPAVNALKGKTFEGNVKNSNGTEGKYYFKFDAVNNSYARGITQESLTSGQGTLTHSCDFFGNVAFIKRSGGIRESGILKEGKLEVILYDNVNHTWSHASLSEIK